MFAYEGLGSIYWHMVSKLMLAVQEIALEEDQMKTLGLSCFLLRRTEWFGIQEKSV